MLDFSIFIIELTMAFHWKFAGEKNYRPLFCDSSHMTVGEIKKKITEFGCLTHSYVRLLDPETEEEWKDEKEWLPRGTTVMADRLPLPKQKKQQVKKEEPLPIPTNASASEVLREVIASSDISKSTASEAEKIKTVLKHSTDGFDPSNFDRVRNTAAPLRPDYQCFRCNQKGHHIKDCPTNNMKIKRSTGIPKSFMVPASADQKGALLSSSGEFAIPKIDLQVYNNNDVDHKPQQNDNDNLSKGDEKEDPIPEELKCRSSACPYGILTNAVFSPCCAEAYCDECYRLLLSESNTSQCPNCEMEGIEFKYIIPVLRLRKAVKRFLAAHAANTVSDPSLESKIDSNDNDKLESNVTVEIEAADNADLNKSASEPIDDTPVESSSLPVTPVQQFSENSNPETDISSQDKILDSPPAVSTNENNAQDSVRGMEEDDEEEKPIISKESPVQEEEQQQEQASPPQENQEKSKSPIENEDQEMVNNDESRDKNSEENILENAQDSKPETRDQLEEQVDEKHYSCPTVIGNVIRPLTASVPFPVPVLSHRFPSYPPPSRPLLSGPPIAPSHRPPFRIPFMQVPFMHHPGYPPQYGMMPHRFNFPPNDVRGPISGYDARGKLKFD